MNLEGRTLIKNTSVLTSFLKGVKPSNGTFILKLFFKGDQLKVKLSNFKFPKFSNGPEFLIGGGGRD